MNGIKQNSSCKFTKIWEQERLVTLPNWALLILLPMEQIRHLAGSRHICFTTPLSRAHGNCFDFHFHVSFSFTLTLVIHCEKENLDNKNYCTVIHKRDRFFRQTRIILKQMLRNRQAGRKFCYSITEAMAIGENQL